MSLIVNPTSSSSEERRVINILMSASEYSMGVTELRGPKDRKVSVAWQDAAMQIFETYLPKHNTIYCPAGVHSFAKTSICCITGCRRHVEVGTHVTTNAIDVWIIPTCMKHNKEGALDHSKMDPGIKKNTVLLEMILPKDRRIYKIGRFYWYKQMTEDPYDIFDHSIVHRHCFGVCRDVDSDDDDDENEDVNVMYL